MGFFEDITGGLVKGGLDILGGQLAAAQNRQAQRFSRDMQEDFARHGVQWRVQDAQEAGVHPLFALGASVTGGQPMALGDVSGAGFAEAGQDIGAAIARTKSGDQQESDRLDLEIKKQTLKESDARINSINDEIARRNAPGVMPGVGTFREGSPLPDGQKVVSGPDPFGLLQGYYENKPANVVSPSVGDTSTEAGVSAGFAKLRLHPNFILEVPASENQEAKWEIFSELPWYLKVAAVRRSAQKYGFDDPERYIRNLITVLGGGSPDRDYTSPQYGPTVPTSADKMRQYAKDVTKKYLGEAPRFKPKFNKQVPRVPRPGYRPY